MASRLHGRIFRKGSRTYFYSSLFFPKEVKEDVFALYAFVRKADDFIDSSPQDKEGYYAFRKAYEKSLLSGKRSGSEIVDRFIDLSKKYKFDNFWTEAFLHSMEMDLYKKSYKDLHEVEEYIYGSAEVIGLMMSRVLGLKDEALECARHQGKAMQYINFIRDINEDLKLGRTYLPQSDLREYGLGSLEYSSVKEKRGAFGSFIEKQVNRYAEWQRKAKEGYRFIPKKYLIPVKTASDMYGWTAKVISRDPFIVYRKKVRPSRTRIIAGLVMNGLFSR